MGARTLAAVGDVDVQRLRLETLGGDEGRHVAEPDVFHPTAGDGRDHGQPARRRVDDELGLWLRERQHAGLQRGGRERDRAVAARGRVAVVVEEEHAELRPVVDGIGDEAAVHIGMAARLVDQELPHAVEVLGRIAPLVEHRLAGNRPDAPGHDPEGLTGRVVVDRCDDHPPAGTATTPLCASAA
jgi:hypothetical protein